MQLTDPEFIDARKRALENNPRSYEPWYETIMFGREIERLVLSKYWRDYSKEKPNEEGVYAAIIDHPCGTGDVWVTTVHWSRKFNDFHYDGLKDVVRNILYFKPMKEFIQELNIPQHPHPQS